MCVYLGNYRICCIFTDDWLMFDDENVTPITSEDVLKLSGGGIQIYSFYIPLFLLCTFLVPFTKKRNMFIFS